MRGKAHFSVTCLLNKFIYLYSGSSTHHGIVSGQVVALDDFSSGSPTNLQNDDGSWSIDLKNNFCFCDLRKKEHADRFLRGADIVYHLAEIGVQKRKPASSSADAQSMLLQDNKLINTNTLQAGLLNNISGYIFVGTSRSIPYKALLDNPLNRILPKSTKGWSIATSKGT